MAAQATASSRVKELFATVNGRLGLGTSPLYGGRSHSQSRRIVDAAIDSGVNYFDTARMYGDGAAEHILGEALPKFRDRVIIVSKGGILPPDKLLARKLMRKALRLAAKAPMVGTRIPKAPNPEARFGVFQPAELRRSLETSLKALRTDYLDVFLLHECSFEDADHPDVRLLLDRLVEEGKIRTYGSATSGETTARLARERPGHMQILQFASHAWHDVARDLSAFSDTPFGVHSVLGDRYRAFAERIRTVPELRVQAESLGVDPDDAPGLAVRLIAHALNSNREGVVLFSTVKPANLIRSLGASRIPSSEAVAIDELVKADKLAES